MAATGNRIFLLGCCCCHVAGARDAYLEFDAVRTFRNIRSHGSTGVAMQSAGTISRHSMSLETSCCLAV